MCSRSDGARSDNLTVFNNTTYDNWAYNNNATSTTQCRARCYLTKTNNITYLSFYTSSWVVNPEQRPMGQKANPTVSDTRANPRRQRYNSARLTTVVNQELSELHTPCFRDYLTYYAILDHLFTKMMNYRQIWNQFYCPQERTSYATCLQSSELSTDTWWLSVINAFQTFFCGWKLKAKVRTPRLFMVSDWAVCWRTKQIV